MIINKFDYINIYNLVLDKIHELRDEKIPKTIGRNPNCYYVTSPDNRSVSRLQGEIVYRGNKISYEQISENSKTFIGTKENPLEKQVYPGVAEDVQIGNIITMGNNYFFEVRSFKQVKPELDEIQKKVSDDTVVM